MGNEGFANGLDSLAVDIGHNYTKAIAIREGRAIGDCEFLTAIAEVDSSKFEMVMDASSFGGQEIRPQFVEWEGRHFIVGDDAFNIADVKQIEGRQRYTRDYYGIILASVIRHIYGHEVPQALNVFAGYPPDDHNQKVPHLKALLGRWTIGTSLGKVSYKIEYAARYPEVLGGAMNVVLGVDGTRYQDHPIVDDGPTIVLDVGGGTFDIVVLKSDGTPDMTRFATRRGTGVNNVIREFRMLFDKKFPELVEDTHGGLPTARIYDCFLDKDKRVRTPAGYINCKDIYGQAIVRTMNTIKQAYKDMGGGSINYNNALVSGGGGGLLWDEISTEVLGAFADGGHLYMSDLRAQMIYANVRGAVKMLSGMMAVTTTGKGKRRVS